MGNASVFRGVFPIGNTNTRALPVPDLETGLALYRDVMGFTVVSTAAEPHPSAVLRRDDAEIGIAVNGVDPEQAGCGFPVSDVDAARRELIERGAQPGEFRVDEYDGKRYRVFFLREPFGVCFCYTQPV